MKDPIEEARRYIDNAKKMLEEKAILNTRLEVYEYSKYVKLAGRALWTGAIIALSYSLKVVPKKSTQRIDIKDFQEAASKYNDKLLTLLVCLYNTANLSMGNDGSKSLGNAKDAIRYTQEIVDWCENNRPQELFKTEEICPKSSKSSQNKGEEENKDS